MDDIVGVHKLNGRQQLAGQAPALAFGRHTLFAEVVDNVALRQLRHQAVDIRVFHNLIQLCLEGV